MNLNILLMVISVLVVLFLHHPVIGLIATIGGFFCALSWVVGIVQANRKP